MALTDFTGDVEVIQKLGTFPNAEDGLTDEELKKKFDEAPAAIKKYLNETLVPEARKLREDVGALTQNISGISVFARFVTSAGYVLSIDTNAMTVRIPKGYVFLKRPRVGQSRLTVEETICAINTESEFSFVAMNVLTTREVVSINPANFDATTQVVLAVLWNRHYTDPAANWIMGPYQVDGEMYNDPAQCSSADEVAALASKASNIGPFITIHDTVLDIVGDSITLNTGYIYARDMRIYITQTTVERNTESSMCLLVYDRSDSTVKCISGWNGLSDTQILIAAISKLYPGNENTNYIPGKWSVDGVVYPKVDMEDVEERLNALEAQPVHPGTGGLKWYALGDSITRGMYGFISGDGAGVDPETCWANLAAQYNGWTLTNKGVSGSGYLVQGGTDPKTNAREQVDATDFSGAELVTLAYGVNDYFQNFGVGTMEDDVSTGGTFISNMRYCIEKILTDNPTAKIVVISPINTCRGSGDTNWGIGKANSAGATLEDFRNAEKSVCEYYGIEFVDMLHSSVVNRQNITTALPDGVHPSRAIHKQMARELSRKIMSACCSPSSSNGGSGGEGGYYKPSVTQVDDSTAQISFAASKAGMPAVAAQQITLPAGPKGDPGADYVLTDTDKSDIAKIVKAEVPLVKTAEQPTFVNSVDEMTDTTKVYVMPDGYIYAYMYVSGGGGKNIMPIGTATVTTGEGLYSVTPNGAGGYILNGDVTTNKVYKIYENTKALPTGFTAGGAYVISRNAVWLGNVAIMYYDGSAWGDLVSIKGGEDMPATTFTIPGNAVGLQIKFYPYMLAGDTYTYDNVTVTLECYEVVEGYVWTNTGHAFVPADYEDRIINLEGKVATLEADVEHLKDGATDDTPKPMLTVIDDDGYKKFATLLLPIVQEKGVPITSAIPAAFASGEDEEQLGKVMEWEEIEACCLAGAEVLAHTYCHLTQAKAESMTKTAIQYDYQRALYAFRKHGFKAETIVYAGGSWGLDKCVDACRNVSAYGIKAGGSVINYKGSTNPHLIARYPIEPDGLLNETDLKALIDTLVSGGTGWMVWMIHTSDGGFQQAQADIISTVIDYAVAQGVEIVTTECGVRHYL